MEAPFLGRDFDTPKSQTYKTLMENYDLKGSLDFAFQYASEINKYVDDMTPWKISTDTDE